MWPVFIYTLSDALYLFQVALARGALVTDRIPIILEGYSDLHLAPSEHLHIWLRLQILAHLRHQLNQLPLVFLFQDQTVILCDFGMSEGMVDLRFVLEKNLNEIT